MSRAIRQPVMQAARNGLRLASPLFRTVIGPAEIQRVIPMRALLRCEADRRASRFLPPLSTPQPSLARICLCLRARRSSRSSGVRAIAFAALPRPTPTPNPGFPRRGSDRSATERPPSLGPKFHCLALPRALAGINPVRNPRAGNPPAWRKNQRCALVRRSSVWKTMNKYFRCGSFCWRHADTVLWL